MASIIIMIFYNNCNTTAKTKCNKFPTYNYRYQISNRTFRRSIKTSYDKLSITDDNTQSAALSEHGCSAGAVVGPLRVLLEDGPKLGVPRNAVARAGPAEKHTLSNMNNDLKRSSMH